MTVYVLTRHRGLHPDSYACILVQSRRSNQNVPQAARWKSVRNKVWTSQCTGIGGWKGNKGDRYKPVRYFLLCVCVCVCVWISQYVTLHLSYQVIPWLCKYLNKTYRDNMTVMLNRFSHQVAKVFFFFFFEGTNLNQIKCVRCWRHGKSAKNC